jgi:hypothetical protein
MRAGKRSRRKNRKTKKLKIEVGIHVTHFTRKSSTKIDAKKRMTNRGRYGFMHSSRSSLSEKPFPSAKSSPNSRKIVSTVSTSFDSPSIIKSCPRALTLTERIVSRYLRLASLSPKRVSIARKVILFFAKNAH